MADYTVIENIFDNDNDDRINTMQHKVRKTMHNYGDMKKRENFDDSPFTEVKNLQDVYNYGGNNGKGGMGIFDENQQQHVQPFVQYTSHPSNTQHLIENKKNLNFLDINNIPTPHQQHDTLTCRSVFMHIDTCPVCSMYLKKDVKFYWFVIIVLVCIILYLTRKK